MLYATAEKALLLSIDNDLKELYKTGKISMELVLQAQTVRLLRGKAVLTVETPVDGWSSNGAQWISNQPGTPYSIGDSK